MSQFFRAQQSICKSNIKPLNKQPCAWCVRHLALSHEFVANWLYIEWFAKIFRIFAIHRAREKLIYVHKGLAILGRSSRWCHTRKTPTCFRNSEIHTKPILTVIANVTPQWISPSSWFKNIIAIDQKYYASAFQPSSVWLNPYFFFKGIFAHSSFFSCYW